MPAIITILYLAPSEGNVHFDSNYYLSTHMPLVSKAWRDHGLLDWQVAELIHSPDSPYVYQAIMKWESVEAFDNACRDHGTAVFADIAKYTNLKVISIKGNVMETWQK